jgi:hypothetical protein
MRKSLGARWGVCPECNRERPVFVHTQRMKEHNRWMPESQEMKWCPGTGQSPVIAEKEMVTENG